MPHYATLLISVAFRREREAEQAKEGGGSWPFS